MDGGSNWTNVGIVSDSSALLLRTTDRLRFVPAGTGLATNRLWFRAWDQTLGTAGTRVDSTANGGTTAFSLLTETADITITSSNPPTATGGNVTGVEDNTYVFSWSDFNVSDIDTPITSQTAIRIDSFPASGTLQYHNGSTWIAVSSGQLLTKAKVDAGLVRFVPLADEAGYNGYSNPGLGDGFNDYAQFSYTPIHSTSLNINNADAELLVVPEEVEVNVNEGTTQWFYPAPDNGGGIYNPTTSDFSTDHDNALFTTGSTTIFQTLASTFSSSNDYSLSLDIGWALCT